MLRWIGRTIVALLVYSACVTLGLLVWVNTTTWLAHIMPLSPVMYDTVMLSVPLAVYPVNAGISLLCGPPIFLAAWVRRQPFTRRAGAACAGLATGLGLVLFWQGTLTWWTGYAFVQRLAVPDPATVSDYLMLALIAGIESWTTLRIVRRTRSQTICMKEKI